MCAVRVGVSSALIIFFGLVSDVDCRPGLPNLLSIAGHFHIRKFIAGLRRFCDVTISYCDMTNPLIFIPFMQYHEVIMSPIFARSVASLYGCKPNLKN